MAVKVYSASDNETRKAWAKDLYHETIERTYFKKFKGESRDSLFQEKTELSKGAGDRVTTTLRANLEGDGIASDGQVEGNEEALQTFTMYTDIDSLDHAVRTPTKGTISAQRVPIEFASEARDALADWWARRLDQSVFNQIAGNTAVTDSRYIGFNATVAPSAGRMIWPTGASAASNLSQSHPFTLNLIDVAVNRAKQRDSNGNYRIRPVRVAGYDKGVYALFVHPNQMQSMRTDASTAGNFFDLWKAALQGGKIPDNPIFTGAEFMYNNVLVHESEFVPPGCVTTTAYANTRRAIMCGAQALTVAFGGGFAGGSMDWEQEFFNYKKELGTNSHLMFGMKKSVFNSKDFATLAIETYAADI